MPEKVSGVRILPHPLFFSSCLLYSVGSAKFFHNHQHLIKYYNDVRFLQRIASNRIEKNRFYLVSSCIKVYECVTELWLAGTLLKSPTGIRGLLYVCFVFLTYHYGYKPKKKSIRATMFSV